MEKHLYTGVFYFCQNGQSATKLQTGERSTTIPLGSTYTSVWYMEMVDTQTTIGTGEDIVYSPLKKGGCDYSNKV